MRRARQQRSVQLFLFLWFDLKEAKAVKSFLATILHSTEWTTDKCNNIRMKYRSPRSPTIVVVFQYFQLPDTFSLYICSEMHLYLFYANERKNTSAGPVTRRYRHWRCFCGRRRRRRQLLRSRTGNLRNVRSSMTITDIWPPRRPRSRCRWPPWWV